MSRRRQLDSDIARFLATGEADPMGAVYPAENLFAALRNYNDTLRAALLAEVRRRERGRRGRRLPAGFEPTAYVRGKVAPMVTGLFPDKERGVVLGVLETAFVFLTRQATHELVADVDYLHSAWMLANMYLSSIGADCFGDGDWAVVGSCEGNRCYVSMEYFAVNSRFADYVVHEAAHVFHNTKRTTMDLPSTRYREWLLEIEFRKRETFAYACEAYSRIIEHARRPDERRELVEEYAGGPMPNDERVDAGELIDILREAVSARNGWKRILARCSLAPRQRATPGASLLGHAH